MLPHMTWGNWLFWGIMVFVGINFLWLGLLERFVPLWIGEVVGLFFFFVFLKYGPREKEKEEEE